MKYSKRPKIDVPLQPIDLWLDRFSFLLFFLIWFYALFNFFNLPDSIPLHFDAHGNADSFGSKNGIWILMGLMTFMFAGLYVLGKFPNLHNYTVQITEDNALKNYRFSTRILRIVNLFDLLLFAYIIKKTMTYNGDNSSELGCWFLPFVLGVSGVFLIFIFIYASKLNSK
ncbi:MAG: DUF1648 domain-containing protein [Flavobacteriaceae bacterium]